jgi:acyl-CoA thioesterase-1
MTRWWLPCLLLLLPAWTWSATIVCLGDSLTAGYGLSEEQAYPAMVEELAKQDHRDWRVVNAGVSGDTTAGGLRRVGWVLRAKPDVVLVALGGNDGLRGMKLEQTRQNLADIAARVQGAGVKACIAGMMLPTNYGDDYRAGFAKIFPEVAAQTKSPLLDFLLAGVGGKPGLNQADGIHPTAEGQKLVARTVYDFLVGVLEPKPEPKKLEADR